MSCGFGCSNNRTGLRDKKQLLCFYNHYFEPDFISWFNKESDWFRELKTQTDTHSINQLVFVFGEKLFLLSWWFSVFLNCWWLSYWHCNSMLRWTLKCNHCVFGGSLMFIEEFFCAVVTNAVITYVISVIFIDTNEKFLIYSIAVCKMTF